MAKSTTTALTDKAREAHEILGVPADASEERVRSAYKALALKWHPDRQLGNREEATEIFVEINRANRAMLRNLRRARRSACSTPSSSVAGSSPSTPASTSSSLPSESRSRQSSTEPSTSSEKIPASHSTPCPIPKDESRTNTRTATTKPSPKTRIFREGTPRGRSSSRSKHPRSNNPSTSKLPKAEPKPTTSTQIPTSSSSSSSTLKPPRTRLRKQPARCKPDLIPEDDTAPKLSSSCKPTTSVAGVTVGPERVEETLHPVRSLLRSAVADVPKRWTHILNMSLEDIHHGKNFHFRIVRYRRSGKKSIVPLDLYVSPGTRGGTEIVVEDAGNERKDGSWQAIVFLVKEIKHEKFRRVHCDLLMDVRLPWVDSLNTEAGQVYFQSLDGKEYKFSIPYREDGLLSGTAVIPGAGLPHRDGDGRGRMVVHWEISSPSSSWDTIKQVLMFKS
ncbi:hypothetical protein CPB83DRAFT_831726 [Crepidotus variabilis]|uniref:J domain-containing protein n=1 Tax=Crepidotus variabilis TaxID=179855 RepID=A0A9P6JVH4_9AGAR|nr:hypothetical protein CPB83DRAFT_831726 [Crepidotus variabilis]